MRLAKLVAPAMLAMLVLGFGVYEGPVFAQGVSSSSVSPNVLSTMTSSTVLHATASHVVQPYGVYHELASGALYAANAVDNVSITMTSGFPSFSYYEANTTLAEWASGCQTETAKQSGANLVLDYRGSACGIAPILKLTFSPAPSATDSCDLYWVDEVYSWCGDAGFSYSAGVLTIVAPSATFNIDPTILQKAGGSCNSCSSGTIASGITFTTVGNIIVITEQAQKAATCTSTILETPQDTAGDTFTLQVEQFHSSAITGTCEDSAIYTATVSSLSSQTLTMKATASIQILTGTYYEISGVTLSGIVTSEGTGTCTGGAASFALSSQTFNPSSVLIGAYAVYGAPTDFAAGSTFALISTGETAFTSQYSTTASSPNTWPASSAADCANTSPWTGTGIALNPLLAQTTLLTVTVNAPPGGAIVYSGTTYSTSTVLTFTSTSTWTVTAAAFASYIFDGWSGFACSDLINPIQTCSITTISSYTTSSTISTTLTASFTSVGGGPSNGSILAAFVICAIILMLCGMAWAVSKR